MVVSLERRRTYTPQYQGLHTKLDPKEAFIAYELIRAMDIAVYGPNKNKVIKIAETINRFRRENQNGQKREDVTPSMIHSFIRHVHENKLTLEDFVD